MILREMLVVRAFQVFSSDWVVDLSSEPCSMMNSLSSTPSQSYGESMFQPRLILRPESRPSIYSIVGRDQDWQSGPSLAANDPRPRQPRRLAVGPRTCQCL